MRISDWSSDVCSSDLLQARRVRAKSDARSLCCISPAELALRELVHAQRAADVRSRDQLQILGGGPGHPPPTRGPGLRQEERRVGQEGVRSGRTRWAACL